MRGWMSIAYLAKPQNLNGGLVARGASGLPFALYPGLTLAVVPPQLDAPRTLTVREVTERAENEALVFFDEVSDLSSAELLASCGPACRPLWSRWRSRSSTSRTEVPTDG